MKSFKTLFMADIHMSNNLPYAMPIKNGLTDRLKDQIKVFDIIKKLAKKKKIDQLFILGDLFDHSKIDAVTLNYTTKKIVEISKICGVCILPGNHDATTTSGGRFAVEYLMEINSKNINVLDMGNDIDLDYKNNLFFWPIKFRPLEDTKKIIKRIRKDMNKKRTNVLLLHNSIIGSTSYEWTCDNGLNPNFVCKDFDMVIAGHFHKSQTFGDCGFYLGAPMQHHFGDIGNDTGVWYIEFLKSKIKKQFIPIKSPKFFVCKGLGEWPKAKKGDYVRHEVNCPYPEFIKKKQKLETACEKLKEKGINADYKHIPVYDDEIRIDVKDDLSNFDIGLTMDKYIEDNLTDSLNRKKLKNIGNEALKAIG